MRAIPITTLALLALAAFATGQEAETSPTEKLKDSVREWIETMREIQKEETAWEQDSEVMKAYREALEVEIKQLEEDVATAKIRKQSGDKDSLETLDERDELEGAFAKLTLEVSEIEQRLSEILPKLPEPLKKNPKVLLGVETLQASLKLADKDKSKDLTKRLFSALEVLAEIEKFQQLVHVNPELHKDKDGREFKVQVVYFGLAMAYGVNEDGSFAITGLPGDDGWTFVERPDLAPKITQLVASATSEKDTSFSQLPLLKP